jgi:serine/threonine protein kinase
MNSPSGPPSRPSPADHPTADWPPDVKDVEQADEQLGAHLDQHLESLGSGSAGLPPYPPSLPELEHLRPVVEQLYGLNQYLQSTESLTPATAVQPGIRPAYFDPSPVTVAERIGKYEVRRPLGQGGQASAYLAFDPDLQRHVVLKLYRQAQAPAEQEAILREGRALARIRSRYVAQVYGVERHEGIPYLVVEYIPGLNLAEQRRRHPYTVDAALELTAQLAEGLSAVHSCGLLHRDIKPANVIVGDDGAPRLVDFGLAATLASDALRHVSGTLAYMAPEQARGEIERIDPRTDLFGLGAVLYELLTGQPPYRANSMEALVQMARAGEVVAPRQHQPQLPPPVNDLCLRCLAKDPGQRFASATELSDAVRRLRTRKHPWRWLWAGVAALVLLAPLAYLALRSAPTVPSEKESIVQAPAEPTPRHPDGRPLHRQFPLQVEMLKQVIDPAGTVLLTAGEPVQLRITSGRDCYVGVWYHDDQGNIVQLFPNPHDDDQLLRKDVPRLIPPEGADYRLNPTVSKGPESIHVFASTKHWAPPGPKQRFGAFGGWPPEDTGTLRQMLRGLYEESEPRGISVEPIKKEERAPGERPHASEVVMPFQVRPKK